MSGGGQGDRTGAREERRQPGALIGLFFDVGRDRTRWLRVSLVAGIIAVSATALALLRPDPFTLDQALPVSVDVFIFLCDGASCPDATGRELETLQAALSADTDIDTIFHDASGERCGSRFGGGCPDRPPHPESTDRWLRFKLVATARHVDAITDRYRDAPGVAAVAALTRDQLEDWCRPAHPSSC